MIYIWAPEMYPTEARSTGLGLASMMARIGGVAAPQVKIKILFSVINLYEMKKNKILLRSYRFKRKSHGFLILFLDLSL